MHRSPEAEQKAEQFLGQWLAAGRPAGVPFDPSRPALIEITSSETGLGDAALLIDEWVLKYLNFAEAYYRDNEG